MRTSAVTGVAGSNAITTRMPSAIMSAYQAIPRASCDSWALSVIPAASEEARVQIPRMMAIL